MRKSWVVLFAGAALTTGMSLGLQGTAVAETAPAGGPVTAQGYPDGCNFDLSGNGSIAVCDRNNGGHYRAVVQCTDLATGDIVIHEPQAWQTSGLSIANCPPLTFAHAAGIDLIDH